MKSPEIIKSIIYAFSAILIALSVDKNIQERQIAQDYIQIAVNIISNSGEDENVELQRWATNIIDKYSPVDLPEKELFINSDINIGTCGNIGSIKDYGLSKLIKKDEK
jgi:hypothetical protein